MRSILDATAITLTDLERAELEALARSTKTEHRMRLKAQIVLMAAEGAATRAIGRTLGCTTGTASKWRVRYAKARLAGFWEVGARGAEPKYDGETDRRILALLDTPPPEGYANWSGPLIAKALGDIHVQYVWRFLRAQKIDLSGRKSWCVSNDPEFAAKAAEIVGLYMAPPENAIVLAVDEKPSIQALERAQGYLKLPNGRAMTGQSHDYKRNGTTTLFAALDLESGKVIGRHYKRRRRVEFLDFMNKVLAEHPDREIHVVLDNLYPQAQARHVAEAPQERPFPLHPDARLLAQPGRNLVLHPAAIARRSIVRQRSRTHRPHRGFHRRLQRNRQALRLDKKQSPPKAPQTLFRRLIIPGTRPHERSGVPSRFSFSTLDSSWVLLPSSMTLLSLFPVESLVDGNVPKRPDAAGDLLP